MAKQHFQRWYEKDEYLKAFMNLMQDLKSEDQCEIAIDIIIKASNMIDRDYTKQIQEVASFNPKNYKRWYDKNISLHSAIEIIRNLDQIHREEII